MQDQSYCLRRATCVVASAAGKPEIVTIPAGEIVTAQDEPSEETRMVSVTWENRTFRMFAIDLEQRGELVGLSSNGSAMGAAH
jgi:hypothetical protein